MPGIVVFFISLLVVSAAVGFSDAGPIADFAQILFAIVGVLFVISLALSVGSYYGEKRSR